MRPLRSTLAAVLVTACAALPCPSFAKSVFTTSPDLYRAYLQMMSIRTLPAAEQPDVEPSFDCRQAYRSDEQAICHDASLAIDDATMGAAYQEAVAVSYEAAVSPEAQGAWLRQRRACGADKSCLRTAYQKRIDALSGSIDRARRKRQ